MLIGLNWNHGCVGLLFLGLLGGEVRLNDCE